MDSDKIGRFIYKLRTEKNLSQYQLADLIPISRQAVSKWERGVTIPDSSTLICLSRIFDVTINELLNGERKETNTIEDLQKTTLSILDESNKKTKALKRTIKIFVLIITVLLLSFLSYYFISSYNTTEVYKIGNDGDIFATTNGILIKTKERLYIKIGSLFYRDDIKINKIEYCYVKDNKEKLIMSDKSIENLIVVEHYGYNEKGLLKDIDIIKNTSYLKITYNDDQVEILKLRYAKDFTNNSIFFKKNRNHLNTRAKETQVQETIKEEEKEETKVEEDPKPETPKEEEKPKEKEKQKDKEKPKEDVKPKTEEAPKEEVKQEDNSIDYNKAINKLKEEGFYYSDSYIYENEDEGIIVIYYEKLNQITIYLNDEELGNVNLNLQQYSCPNDPNCEESINKILTNI